MMAFTWFVLCLASIGLLMATVALYRRGTQREEQDRVYARLASRDSGQAGDINLEPIRNPVIAAISRRMIQAGYAGRPVTIYMGLSGLAVLGLTVGWAFGPAMAAFIVIVLALAAHLLLLQRSARRHRALMLQLPDFMDRLLHPLIAGNTIEESFVVATRESPMPVRELFLSVARQVRFGAPLEDALTRMAGLYDLTDLHALAMAVKVHRRYGGSIRQMVKSLMYMARSRETAAQELRALTAETRMSAWLLVAIPVGITCFILLRNPEYYSAMWSHGTGRAILCAGFALQLLGAAVIWRMMRRSLEAST